MWAGAFSRFVFEYSVSIQNSLRSARTQYDAQPAPLAGASTGPAQFPHTTGAGNDNSRHRVQHQELLQLSVFVVIEVIGAHAIERDRLNEYEH